MAAKDDTRGVRRAEALVALGALGAGAAWLASRAGAAVTGAAGSAAEELAAVENATCVLTPEQTEGPFWIDTGLTRRDVRAGRPGAPLDLRLTVVDASSCRAVRNAAVEIWHCDHRGVYSGVSGGGGNGSPSPSDPTRFLRGVQRTNAAGLARFLTIYPGWYPGRTTHIHLKVWVGGDEVFTGQVYFPESVSAAVYRQAPYASRGQKDTPNAGDGVFSGAAGRATLRMRRRATGKGWIGSITLGIDA